MTFQECLVKIASTKDVIGVKEYKGYPITKLIPAPVGVTPDQMADWFAYSLGLFPVRTIQTLSGDFEIMAIYQVDTEVPTSQQGVWMYQEFPELLES